MKKNVMTYPKQSEMWWKNQLKDMCEYEPKTTFFSDLSIAECYGNKAIKDTYKKVIKEWGENIVYMTEFVLCLNHKIWQLFNIDRPTAELYNDLWHNACIYVEKNFKGKDLNYYYRIVD